ncbi:MAG: TIGR03618 family F420-dependent PPOX class oxidoreductase [Dehalococcoidia bacterium]|nr:TIGR03618 family F420-dependent PPOX class oxidoreductase [Dehalococcoidia bacterium]
MVDLSDDVRGLIEDANLAHFVTLMKSGAPQVTPVWVDHDGTHVLINTAEGRQKALNLKREPRVALSVVDRNNSQRYVQVRGRVVQTIGGEEAYQHINKLSKKYSNNPNREYPRREGEQRLILKVRPDHVFYRPGARRD